MASAWARGTAQRSCWKQSGVRQPRENVLRDLRAALECAACHCDVGGVAELRGLLVEAIKDKQQPQGAMAMNEVVDTVMGLVVVAKQALQCSDYQCAKECAAHAQELLSSFGESTSPATSAEDKEHK